MGRHLFFLSLGWFVYYIPMFPKMSMNEEDLWRERLQIGGIHDFQACLCKMRPARQVLPREKLLQVSGDDIATLNSGRELAGSVIMRYLQVQLKLSLLGKNLFLPATSISLSDPFLCN